MTDTPRPSGLAGPERHTLLALARASVADAVLSTGSLEQVLACAEITPPLRLSHGVFVTLKLPAESGSCARLRGCIGTFSSAEPLYRTVIDTAPRAAMNDPRFSPLEASELPVVRVGISVLNPARPVDDVGRLVVGRDGVILEKDFHRSVFLPQVAEEQGWTVTQLLEHLALKAGLDRDGWRNAALSAFQAENFAETDGDSI